MKCAYKDRRQRQLLIERDRKIVAVSEYVFSHQNSTGYFWERAISYLSQEGYSVRTVTYTIDMGNQIRANLFLRLGAKIYVMARLCWASMRQLRAGDVLFAGTNPEILLPFLLVLCRFRSAKLCVLVHDVFPENLVAAGVLRPGSRRLWFLEILFGALYARIDAAVVIGRDMQRLVDTKAGKSVSRFVHNWVASSDIEPIARGQSSILTDLGWENKFVFQFFGNMGRLQDFENLLEAIKLVKSTRFAVLFAGYGIGRQQVSNFCSGHVDRHLIPEDHGYSRSEILAACDVSLVTLKSNMLGLGVPSKAYFSLAADRPLLAAMDAGSEVAEIISEYHVGWVLPPGDPQAMARKIDELCDDGTGVAVGHCRTIALGPLAAEKSLEQLGHTLNRLMI